MSDDRLSHLTECGIPGIRKVPWGSHFCQFYRQRQDLVESLVPYFQTGLRNNERCLWVTSASFPAEDAQAELGKVMPSRNGLMKKQKIQIRNYDELYRNVKGLETDVLGL